MIKRKEVHKLAKHFFFLYSCGSRRTLLRWMEQVINYNFCLKICSLVHAGCDGRKVSKGLGSKKKNKTETKRRSGILNSTSLMIL